MKKLYLSLLIVLASLCSAVAQSPLEKQVTINQSDATLEEILHFLVDKHGVKLSFSSEILPVKKTNIYIEKKSLRYVLDLLLEKTGVAYRVLGQQVVLYRWEPLVVQSVYTISGFFEDAATGERLIAASVYDQNTGKGTTTNEYGFYSLTLPAGRVELTFSYLGYEPETRRFFLNDNKKISPALRTSLTLTEVIVLASDTENEESRRSGSSEFIHVADIDRLPNLGGESDVLRVTHLLPGVQTGTDGIGGVYIRGGDPGQNLILIDGVPVYNVSHAAGLFSIFNTSAIQSAKLVKGGFPARYGGRISSVLDIRTKEGNKKEFGGRADVGLLTSRLSLEGPIVKDKSSFFVSGRLSLLDWYIQPLSRDFKEDNGETGSTSYKFYDVNAKFNHSFSERDRVYLSYYNGSDRFVNQGSRADSLSLLNVDGNPIPYRFDQGYEEQLQWGNTIAALRWNHLFNEKLFGNITATYSKLAVDVDYFTADSLLNLQTGNTVIEPVFDLGKYRSSIEDVGFRLDFDYIPNTSHYLRFGINYTGHHFRPGALTVSQSSDYSDLQSAFAQRPTRTREMSIYIEDELRILRDLTLNLGMHFSSWSVRDENYRSLQPRLLAYWRATEKLGIHASFTTMTQFLHLLSTSSIGLLPTDLWVPATDKVTPQDAVQVVGGIDLKLWKNFDLGLEGYYKKMNNLINFTEGAFFLNNWEENVTTGEGRAFGVEFFLRKHSGQTTGWLAYSLSQADRLFERVNLARRFPFKYDRRHDLKIVIAHRFTPWMEATANWIFSSGFAYSDAREKYTVILPGSNPSEIEVPVYSGKNQARMPYYHRLDVSLNFNFQTKSVKHAVNLGAYNLYNRRNPLYYDLRTRYVNDNNELKPTSEYVQVWLIPLLPSLSYSVKF